MKKKEITKNNKKQFGLFLEENGITKKEAEELFGTKRAGKNLSIEDLSYGDCEDYAENTWGVLTVQYKWEHPWVLVKVYSDMGDFTVVFKDMFDDLMYFSNWAEHMVLWEEDDCCNYECLEEEEEEEEEEEKVIIIQWLSRDWDILKCRWEEDGSEYIRLRCKSEYISLYTKDNKYDDMKDLCKIYKDEMWKREYKHLIWEINEEEFCDPVTNWWDADREYKDKEFEDSKSICEKVIDWDIELPKGFGKVWYDKLVIEEIVDEWKIIGYEASLTGNYWYLDKVIGSGDSRSTAAFALHNILEEDLTEEAKKELMATVTALALGDAIDKIESLDKKLNDIYNACGINN